MKQLCLLTVQRLHRICLFWLRAILSCELVCVCALTNICLCPCVLRAAVWMDVCESFSGWWWDRAVGFSFHRRTSLQFLHPHQSFLSLGVKVRALLPHPFSLPPFSSLAPSKPDQIRPASAHNTAGLSGAIDLWRTLLSPERKPSILYLDSLSVTPFCEWTRIIRVKHHHSSFYCFIIRRYFSRKVDLAYCFGERGSAGREMDKNSYSLLTLGVFNLARSYV